ncbi:enoyl-CoA hydratase [Gordonia paraffinivorans]|uniref:enoyl-CoA hydratase n=1 Tax=Gordonia paraffinivorans TaxID=175628 RepID=UPI001446D7D7|nr:enoyl-CoA hydratase [Gordonia paraffinivorans]
MKKFLAVAATVCAAIMLSAGGVGVSSAASIPQVSTTGNDFGMFGDHSFCRGSVRVTLDAPEKTRGIVRVTVRSHGFTGEGASWKRNPKCRIKFASIYTRARAYYAYKWNTVSFGPRRGETKTRDVHTGSGLVGFTVSAYSANSPVAVPQSYGYGGYLLVS